MKLADSSPRLPRKNAGQPPFGFVNPRISLSSRRIDGCDFVCACVKDSLPLHSLPLDALGHLRFSSLIGRNQDRGLEETRHRAQVPSRMRHSRPLYSESRHLSAQSRPTRLAVTPHLLLESYKSWEVIASANLRTKASPRGRLDLLCTRSVAWPAVIHPILRVVITP